MRVACACGRWMTESREEAFLAEKSISNSVPTAIVRAREFICEGCCSVALVAFGPVEGLYDESLMQQTYNELREAKETVVDIYKGV